VVCPREKFIEGVISDVRAKGGEMCDRSVEALRKHSDFAAAIEHQQKAIAELREVSLCTWVITASIEG
jgi:hypothetical protein